jgi:hypothetical protein
MSTEYAHKVVNLYGEQTATYENAREAVKQELGQDVTEGEIIQELARAYTGYDGDVVPEPVAGMIDDHASNHDAPVLPYSALKKMSNKRIRRMAAEADTDAISGRDTRMEWYSFFGKGGENE